MLQSTVTNFDHVRVRIPHFQHDISEASSLRKEVEGLRRQIFDTDTLQEKNSKLTELLSQVTEDEAKVTWLVHADGDGVWEGGEGDCVCACVCVCVCVCARACV
jgi:hypothetical protein